MTDKIQFTDRDLQDIRDRVSIRELVGKTIPLKRRAPHDFWGPSPFKAEKTPSFHVREDKGFYHCFATGNHGDIFTFVMHTRKCTFPEAVEYLAEIAGVKLQRGTVDPKLEAARATGLGALADAAMYFHKELRGNSIALEYAKKRGMTDEIINTFQLGYAPDAWQGATAALQQKGYTAKQLLETGIGVEGGREGLYDRFRDRLMFPIHDMKGRAIAFGGRVLNKGEPKYLNSSDSPYFHKGHTLYNLQRAYELIREKDQAFIVEGYMDVIGLWQFGVKTAVAPLGTAITEDQVKTLWRYCPMPTVCLDGDAAGQSAAFRLARRILKALVPGKGLQFGWLTPGDDPDSFVRKHGGEAFLQAMKSTQPLEDVLWLDLTRGKELKSATAKAGLEKEIDTLCKEIEDPVCRKQMQQAFKDRMWQLGREKQGVVKPTARKVNVQAGFTGPDLLLAWLVQNPALLPYVEEQVMLLEHPQPERSAVQATLLKVVHEQGVETESLHHHLREVGLWEVATVLLELAAMEAPADQTIDGLKARWLALFDEIHAKQRRAKLAPKGELDMDGMKEFWARAKNLTK